jgi:hypothetical protein
LSKEPNGAARRRRRVPGEHAHMPHQIQNVVIMKTHVFFISASLASRFEKEGELSSFFAAATWSPRVLSN